MFPVAGRAGQDARHARREIVQVLQAVARERGGSPILHAAAPPARLFLARRYNAGEQTDSVVEVCRACFLGAQRDEVGKARDADGPAVHWILIIRNTRRSEDGAATPLMRL